MTPEAAQTAYDKIVAHINKQGGSYSSWYAGITSDWEGRLFGDHQVPRKDYWRTVHQCFTDTDARYVERALLNLGCDGGSGGGDLSTVYVYAYLMGPQTNP